MTKEEQNAEKDKQFSEPIIPPMQGDVRGLTPFQWRMERSSYSNPYWYAVLVAFFAMLYTPEVMKAYAGWLAVNIARDMQSDAYMLGMITFWLICFAIPLGAVWLLLRMRKKAHD